MYEAKIGDDINYNVDKGTGEVLPTHNDMTFELRRDDLEKQDHIKKAATEREKKCSFKCWGQLNFDYLPQLRNLIKTSPTAADLLLYIIENMDDRNSLICKQSVFCTALDVSLPSITRAVRVLKDLNYIKVEKFGNMNAYHVNSELLWKSWSGNKRYAELTDSEILFNGNKQVQKRKFKRHKSGIII